MHLKSILPLAIMLAPAVFSSGCTMPPGGLDTSAQIKRFFADPPREYSSAPLWVWNDHLTEDQVIGTLRSLAAEKVKQAFVHPRPGLITPYLSADWFRLWKVALEEAERLDMNLWIYDENSYPSGFAGGFVPEAMPESRGRGLGMRETKESPKWQEDTLAVFRLTGLTYEDATSEVRAGQKLPEARYLEMSLLRAKPGPWYGGKWYVDLLYPGVTQKFLSITMDAYKREVGSQFGNVRAVKEIASVANQLGRERTLCEAYGAGGWDLRFEDMKRIGDWLYVLGVNTLDQHLSYVSLRGARKRDHPQSFSYHEPWWEAYHVSAEYFARLSLALSKGEEINPILVIEPTTTAWMYNTAGKNPPELEDLGETFQKLLVSLARAQVEYDIGDEDVLARNGSVAGNLLRVGQRGYATVVLPRLTENLNAKTLDLVEGDPGTQYLSPLIEASIPCSWEMGLRR